MEAIKSIVYTNLAELMANIHFLLCTNPGQTGLDLIFDEYVICLSSEDWIKFAHHIIARAHRRGDPHSSIKKDLVDLLAKDLQHDALVDIRDAIIALIWNKLSEYWNTDVDGGTAIWKNAQEKHPDEFPLHIDFMFAMLDIGTSLTKRGYVNPYNKHIAFPTM